MCFRTYGSAQLQDITTLVVIIDPTGTDSELTKEDWVNI